MNRQIQEIAAQAGYPDHMTYGQDKVLERFAELIVRECARVCVEVGDANSDIYPEFGNGAYFSANRVKQHFGVEE